MKRKKKVIPLFKSCNTTEIFFKTRLKHNVLKNLVWKTKDWIFDHVMQVTVFSVVYRYLQEQTGFQQTQGSVADGVLTCGFDLQKSAIDLDADSYLFFANGEIFPKKFNGKSHTFVYSFSRQWFRIQVPVNMLPMCYILVSGTVYLFVEVVWIIMPTIKRFWM